MVAQSRSQSGAGTGVMCFNTAGCDTHCSRGFRFTQSFPGPAAEMFAAGAIPDGVLPYQDIPSCAGYPVAARQPGPGSTASGS